MARACGPLDFPMIDYTMRMVVDCLTAGSKNLAAVEGFEVALKKNAD